MPGEIRLIRRIVKNVITLQQNFSLFNNEATGKNYGI